MLEKGITHYQILEKLVAGVKEHSQPATAVCLNQKASLTNLLESLNVAAPPEITPVGELTRTSHNSFYPIR